MLAAKHPLEAERLAALRAYDILDSLPEQDYDDLVRIAAAICRTPIAAITLIDQKRQWFKSTFGLGGAKETPLEASLCAHTILMPGKSTIVLDLTQDVRFADSSVVDGSGDNLRFYAGAPIIAPTENLPLGAICVADRTARGEFTSEEVESLGALSRQVSHLLDLRRTRAELVRVNEDLATMASTDPLTGLANRRALESRLSEEIGRAGRLGTDLSVLMIDIDHFKRLNDTYGHPIGDEALRKVASLLRDGCRKGTGDTVGRLGGEEFAILLPGTSLHDAMLLAERLRDSVAKNRNSFGPVTISIGAAHLNPRERVVGDSGTTLLANADRALYQAKEKGRNRVETLATEPSGIK